MKTRDEEINKAYDKWQDDLECSERTVWQCACRWADEHPKNPWRDVKKELPKEKCKVYVLKNGVPDFAIYTGRKKNKTFVTAYLVRHLVGTYLDISENGIEFKKDVSALFRKDITNEVTHWMPIHELLKGGEA